MAEGSSSSKPTMEEGGSKPTVVIVLGMAGSGKTTFVQKLSSHLRTTSKDPYLINLDPAVTQIPFTANIDIQDTIDYKQVMQQYGLGPNGAIMTSLNLFSTKFDQVMDLVDKRSTEVDYVVCDTPGQIEVFTWSASGSIIAESFASSFPTVVVYVMDTARCTSPVTFMSNMLYACSILYKFKLPFIVVMNKTDIVDHQFAVEWTTDFEAFTAAISESKDYISVLMSSMSLVLEEFYQHLKLVGFSSDTGAGMDELLKAIGEAREEYIKDFKPEYDESKRKMLEAKESGEAAGSSGEAIIVTKGTENVEDNYGNEDADADEVETAEDVESLRRYLEKSKLQSEGGGKCTAAAGDASSSS